MDGQLQMVRSHGKDRVLSKIDEKSCFGSVLAPSGEQVCGIPVWAQERSAASRPSRGVSTLGAGDALGMTASGVLDDEALQLALKDASVKGKLSLAYLDLTEITSEQATRVRAVRRTSPSWIYGRTTSRTCPMSSATSRRCG